MAFASTGCMRPLPTRNTLNGFTLVETLVAIGVFGIAVTGVIVALLQMNNFASSGRNQTNAKALCQERIEQVLTASYNSAGTVPAILQENQAPEQVSIYMDKDNSTVRIPGTRTTTVTTADASLKLLNVTVTVTYLHAGKTSTYEMHTMRAPD